MEAKHSQPDLSIKTIKETAKKYWSSPGKQLTEHRQLKQIWPEKTDVYGWIWNSGSKEDNHSLLKAVERINGSKGSLLKVIESFLCN